MNVKKMWPYVAATACVLFAGCSTPAVSTQALARLASQDGLKNGTQTNSGGGDAGGIALTRADFVTQVQDELGECEKSAEKMGYRTAAARSTQLTIATVGIVAGSIVVPALAAKATVARSTVAAWGGIAGAANAAQAALSSSGLSPEQAVVAQRAYLDGISATLDELKTVKDGPEAAAFLIKLRFKCRFGLPLTDASHPDDR